MAWSIDEKTLFEKLDDEMFPWEESDGHPVFLEWSRNGETWECQAHHDQPGNEYVVTNSDLRAAIREAMELVKEQYAPEPIGFYLHCRILP